MYLDWGDSIIWWYSEQRSNFENNVAPFKVWIRSFMIGVGWHSWVIALFALRMSTHMCTTPFFFGINTNGDTHEWNHQLFLWYAGSWFLRLHQNQPNDISWCHFHLYISHKAAKSMAKLISQSCGELQQAVCLPRGYGVIWRRSEHSWTSDKPQKQATAKAAKATFSLNTGLNC